MDTSPQGLSVAGLALLLASAGVLIGFFGQRLFKVVLALVGFLAGAVAGGGLSTLFSGGSATVVWVATILCGVIGALVLVWAFHVGVFLVGALAGVVLGGVASASLTGVLQVLVVAMLAVVGGLLALRLQRVVLGLATAIVGAALVVLAGLQVVLGPDAATTVGSAALAGRALGQAGWIAIVAWMLLALAGSSIQLGAKKRKKG